jgi:hypothetical protein
MLENDFITLLAESVSRQELKIAWKIRVLLKILLTQIKALFPLNLSYLICF